MAPAPPAPKALLSAEAVKASGDMRRCLEALGGNLQNVKKTVVMLELLVRLVFRNDDCIGYSQLKTLHQLLQSSAATQLKLIALAQMVLTSSGSKSA